jgi:hypothetical protein
LRFHRGLVNASHFENHRIITEGSLEICFAYPTAAIDGDQFGFFSR